MPPAKHSSPHSAKKMAKARSITNLHVSLSKRFLDRFFQVAAYAVSRDTLENGSVFPLRARSYIGGKLQRYDATAAYDSSHNSFSRMNAVSMWTR